MDAFLRFRNIVEMRSFVALGIQNGSVRAFLWLKGYRLTGMALYLHRFPVVGSVTEVCSKLIAMRSVRHAPNAELPGVCAVHGTPMHALSAVSIPRADCFSGQRSAATFYLALQFSVHPSLLGEYLDRGSGSSDATERWARKA